MNTEYLVMDPYVAKQMSEVINECPLYIGDIPQYDIGWNDGKQMKYFHSWLHV